MPQGPLGGPRPLAEGQGGKLTILLPFEPSEQSNLFSFLADNKDRIEDILSFRLEKDLSSEIHTFAVIDVNILFSSNQVMFRVDTGEDRLTGHDFNEMTNTIIKVLQEEVEPLDNTDVAVEFKQAQWEIMV